LVSIEVLLSNYPARFERVWAKLIIL
jgi:hypothetical protein